MAAIERDGKDPQLLRNLSIIGQVRVPTEQIPLNQPGDMRMIIKNRQAISIAESTLDNKTTSLKNKLTVKDLGLLLELRKGDPEEWTSEKLASRFNMDPPTVQILLDYVDIYSLPVGSQNKNTE